MIVTKVIDFKGYDDAVTGRSISYTTQRVGTGEFAGFKEALVAAPALTPGRLVDSTDAIAIDGTIYTPTDISATSGIPLEIRSIAEMCYSDDVHTAHEAKLRG